MVHYQFSVIDISLSVKLSQYDFGARTNNFDARIVMLLNPIFCFKYDFNPCIKNRQLLSFFYTKTGNSK